MFEMTQAVQNKGLSIDRYNSIRQLAQADPEVQRKVQEPMDPEQSRRSLRAGPGSRPAADRLDIAAVRFEDDGVAVIDRAEA